MNHGSYGACPVEICEHLHTKRLDVEKNPDTWYRGGMYSEMEGVRRELSHFLNAPAEDLVLVENASTAMNSILRSLALQLSPEDVVVIFDCAYEMVLNTLKYLQEHVGFQLHILPVGAQFTRQSLLHTLADFLASTPAVKMACLDHISSRPAILFPLQEMISACHSQGVIAVVDAAHALGQTPVDLRALNPDFYVSNAHKWLYSAKGTAMLYVSPAHQPGMRPAVLSGLGRGASPFQLHFSYTGTRDMCGYLSIPAALAFRRDALGGDEACRYMHTLACEGGRLLAHMWHTRTLADSDLTAAITNVVLPAMPDAVAQGLPTALNRPGRPFRTWVPTFKYCGEWFVRVCAQVYLEITDFQALGEAVLAILAEAAA